jgi:hypothetical protein
MNTTTETRRKNLAYRGRRGAATLFTDTLYETELIGIFLSQTGVDGVGRIGRAHLSGGEAEKVDKLYDLHFMATALTWARIIWERIMFVR